MTFFNSCSLFRGIWCILSFLRLICRHSENENFAFYVNECLFDIELMFSIYYDPPYLDQMID